MSIPRSFDNRSHIQVQPSQASGHNLLSFQSLLYHPDAESEKHGFVVTVIQFESRDSTSQATNRVSHSQIYVSVRIRIKAPDYPVKSLIGDVLGIFKIFISLDKSLYPSFIYTSEI